jgi:HSP20 family protein
MPNLPAHRERRETTPARWDPWRDMAEMRQRMDRLFEQFMGGAGREGDGGVWSPPVDLEETDDAWVVEADLPGVKKDDVSVELRDNELEIHGESKEQTRSGVLHRHARRTGQFDYRVTLPGEIDAERDVDAQLSDGVLRVRVPKGEHSQPRRVEIKSG